MVQGKVKNKVTLPANCKQKSTTRINKASEKRKSTATMKKTIQNVVKKNLESSIKTSIENDLCSQAKSCEGKSFKILKP